MKKYEINDKTYISINDIEKMIDNIKNYEIEIKRYGLARLISYENLDIFYEKILENIDFVKNEIIKIKTGNVIIEKQIDNRQLLIEYICKLCVLSNLDKIITYSEFMNFVQYGRYNELEGMENAKENIGKLMILCDVKNWSSFRKFINVNSNKVFGYKIKWIDGGVFVGKC